MRRPPSQCSPICSIDSPPTGWMTGVAAVHCPLAASQPASRPPLPNGCAAHPPTCHWTVRVSVCVICRRAGYKHLRALQQSRGRLLSGHSQRPSSRRQSRNRCVSAVGFEQRQWQRQQRHIIATYWPAGRVRNVSDVADVCGESVRAATTEAPVSCAQPDSRTRTHTLRALRVVRRCISCCCCRCYCCGTRAVVQFLSISGAGQPSQQITKIARNLRSPFCRGRLQRRACNCAPLEFAVIVASDCLACICSP